MKRDAAAGVVAQRDRAVPDSGSVYEAAMLPASGAGSGAGASGGGEHLAAGSRQPAGTESGLAALGARAKESSRVLALSSSAARNEALQIAAALLGEYRAEILASNGADVHEAERMGASLTALDRLKLSPARIDSMAEGLIQVAGLADPLGEVVGGWVRPNGLKVSRVRVPLGVIAVIYENRPNVTSDAAGLCVKAGNAVMLRGSSSALRSNLAVAAVLREAMAKAGLPEDSVVMVEDTSRESAVQFMRLRGLIDCLIPRGGPSLISSVLENATVPVVIDGDGNCHVYVDSSADLDMAVEVVVNAKTQRPGVCNAAESLLVHSDIAEEFLPMVASAMPQVELRGDKRSCQILSTAVEASEEDFATEFLSLVMSVAVVDDLQGAIDHIARFGSGHSEAILTRDLKSAERFVSAVDAAAVLVNASTRFVDGGELGLGAEIGISTQKLHARGPMGLEALTSVKYVVRGDGQVRS
ncbi:MAG: glutamate-5-semialdehyde dehydrogenase [Actinobacteria bacterium]|nr:glutamate-5-semialdehyde dehydrogenase [Actinomycetota bacterium]